ncbi:bis(5'-nucleosyl)-tetraphosphatase (symmetrical) YqeK [Gudongella sp. DL1XJH-153]|uniref:bis(5'-nucleosyl)-tetraphosphatase (symmetrical) YqeK n=1 Tax=Gudongella sp. DL1XJH-153 TaxID=3409804 RepID=UPI003BB68856
MDRIIEVLRDRIGEKRLEHTLSVVEESLILAKKHKAPEEKVKIAALLHDFAKNITLEESIELVNKYNLELDDITKTSTELIHGPLGARMVRDYFNIGDQEILNAITYHTTGKENMTTVEKIVFLADFIEPARNFDGIELIRERALENLDEAILMALDSTISYLINKRSIIHVNTVNARNYLLKNGIGE